MMKKLICSVCKKKVHKLTFIKANPNGICPSCRRRDGPSGSYLGIDVFPAEGIFLEHVEPKGRRFFSKGEMRDYEKKTGTLIHMLH